MGKILEGKVIIVTGAGGGIGRESSRVFASAGAKLVLADIGEQGLRETLDAIRADGFDAESVVTDVGDEESVRGLVAHTMSRYQRLDGAFNNAAVEQASKPLTDLSLAEWERAMRVDLTGVFLCLKYQIPAMLASGGGSIVNTSSAAAEIAFPYGAEYISAKAGVLGLTRAAAVDFGARGIRINAILPGVIRTPMVQRLSEDPRFRDFLGLTRERHILKRFGESAEVGEVAKWLLSDGATFVQGACINVDGGFSINGGQ
ncbi:SDR family NAD(P)-dependent oxidoreductase [Ferribacterium limneticum]|uniref:SDR family NAD(P)-dependent oxidoreductase n=1 Tax=Ferribacterium limneticum TaxID=76259 RepID=UPI001CFB8C62|nr:SDR family oxidoreductase [Ferribacterium limneticum]UCV17795.1 SDR family oxidoreductase [Ferribacterium limneticum]